MHLQDEPQHQWVIAEQCRDGTQRPMLVVDSEREAIDIVEKLRTRGSNVIAVAVGPEHHRDAPHS